MNFSARLGVLDSAVEDHLCDDAAYQVQGESPLIRARVMVDRPVDIERLQGVGFSRPRPVLQVSAAAIPGLRTGDTFVLGQWIGSEFIPGDESWRLAEAPTRPGDGRWWRVEVEPL